MTPVGGAVFFGAYDGTELGLWQSDGSQAGTVLVKNVRVQGLANVGGTLYFGGPAPTVEQTDALWKSDGTEGGTVMITDINPFPSNGGIGCCFGGVGGTLLFSGNDGLHGFELWRSDGTAAGTFRLRVIHNNPEFVGGTALFQSGGALWKTDGTAAGTVLVKDIDTSGSGFQFFTAIVGTTLFFRANDGPAHGVELWKSDGTADGTVLVKDIRPGGSSSFAEPLAGAGGTLFFHAQDGTTGRELWKSDGTEPGTVLVKDINPGGNSDPDQPAAVGGTLFFSADDGTRGTELWKSDGTAAGTLLVKDINPTADDSSYPESLLNVDGTLFFSADDGTNGVELWQSNGTAAGTVMVKDLNPAGDSRPQVLTNLGGTLFFYADDGVHGIELWKLVVDADGDGIPDASDACPAVAEDLDGVQDTDGCPETDADADGIFDEVDEQPLVVSNRFSDKAPALGGRTSGQIVRVPPPPGTPSGTPPTIQVFDHSDPAKGVRVTVTGGSGSCSSPATPCPRAEVRLDGKGSVSRLRSAGTPSSPATYTVTDPEASFTVETEVGGPAEVELVVNGQTYLIVIQSGEEATIREVDNDNNGSVDEATITPGQGDTIDVNGQPTSQPTTIGAAPSCNGTPATIYVNASGKIVGGPGNGTTYAGTLTGTGGADVIVGTNGKDKLLGKAGADLLCGLDGDDLVRGNAGADTLFGGDGKDRMEGAGGNDTFTGNDPSTGLLFADAFIGEAGNDTATDFKRSEGDTKQSIEQF